MDAAIKARRLAALEERMASMQDRLVKQLTQLRNLGEWKRIEYLKRVFPAKDIAQAERTIAMRQATQRAIQIAEASAWAEAEIVAIEGSLLAGAGTTALAVTLPFVGMVAVQVALGAGYYEAREMAKKEETYTGFTRGFVMGCLKWTWDWVLSRFPIYFPPNPYDDDMPSIRSMAYLHGLQTGFIAGTSLPTDDKKLFLLVLRQLSGASSAGWEARSNNWLEQHRAMNVQSTYVIELAVALKKHGIIKAD